MSQSKNLKGHVERITFRNDETGFTVAKVQEPGRQELTCIVGSMGAIQVGENICAQGKWIINAQYGRQFSVDSLEVTAPADLIGIQKYLESGLIKGIGPKYAKNIVETFGIKTLDIISENPNRLSQVPGIGKKRLEQIKTCWSEQSVIREVMVFLQAYGVSPAYAQKIYKVYGHKSIERVKENPFHLAKDIVGIGFKIADAIATQMGIGKDTEMRIDAGIEYLLKDLSNSGHTCYPLADFLKEAANILEVSDMRIIERVEYLKEEQRVFTAFLLNTGKSIECIWLRVLYLCERGIAQELDRIYSTSAPLRHFDHEQAINWVQNTLKITLAKLQKKAILESLNKKIHIITGGPGTGKSTITHAILGIMSHLTPRILLAAPTGRAAKRMAEITGREAKTIHSLLKYDFAHRGFKHNRENPLECDLMIVDESSMLDTYLMYQLLQAIPNQARLIFVGDINQLPSVGPGNVLKDMIHSQRIPVTALTEIFRQAQGSDIIVYAHSINCGHVPEIRNEEDSDFFFIQANEKEKILQHILNVVSTRLPKRYDFNPISDIQVLSPMKKGLIGTEHLNTTLQKALNEHPEAITRREMRYAPGDKVMQIRNNYKKEVFNGDIGYIDRINIDQQTLTIFYDQKLVSYTFNELDEVNPAYAVSVHKYQGSECPCIVMPIHTAHYKLLYRNLLYTGVTRGKKLVILIGSRKALSMAVHNDEVKKRYTALKQTILEISV